MSEKPPLQPLLQGGDGENFVHPTAPPSYSEAMSGGSQVPQHVSQGMPVQPYQPGNIPYPAVPQHIPQGMPPYPTHPGNVMYPAVPQPVPNMVVNVPQPPQPVQSLNVTIPVTQAVALGPKGMRMRCVHCGADIKSTTISSYKAAAHLACLILCIFSCCLCAWIPYCMESCKRIDHKCPNCKRHLGSYND